MQFDHIKQKCQNENCDCEVEPGGSYCSEHCRQAVEFAPTADAASRAECGCEHAECAGRELSFSPRENVARSAE